MAVDMLQHNRHLLHSVPALGKWRAPNPLDTAVAMRGLAVLCTGVHGQSCFFLPYLRRFLLA